MSSSFVYTRLDILTCCSDMQSSLWHCACPVPWVSSMACSRNTVHGGKQRHHIKKLTQTSMAMSCQRSVPQNQANCCLRAQEQSPKLADMSLQCYSQRCSAELHDSCVDGYKTLQILACSLCSALFCVACTGC